MFGRGKVNSEGGKVKYLFKEMSKHLLQSWNKVHVRNTLATRSKPGRTTKNTKLPFSKSWFF